MHDGIVSYSILVAARLKIPTQTCNKMQQHWWQLGLCSLNFAQCCITGKTLQHVQISGRIDPPINKPWHKADDCRSMKKGFIIRYSISSFTTSNTIQNCILNKVIHIDYTCIRLFSDLELIIGHCSWWSPPDQLTQTIHVTKIWMLSGCSQTKGIHSLQIPGVHSVTSKHNKNNELNEETQILMIPDANIGWCGSKDMG